MKIIKTEKEWLSWFGKLGDKAGMRAIEWNRKELPDYPFGVIRFDWGRIFLVFVTENEARRLAIVSQNKALDELVSLSQELNLYD